MDPSRTIGRLGAVIVCGAALAFGATGCGGGEDGGGETERTALPMSTVQVRQGDLTSEEDFDATVTHGEQWPVTTSASGTVTLAHPKGTVINFGDVLVGIDNQSIVLAKGSVPMYREMYNPARVASPPPTPADVGVDGNEPGEVVVTTTTTTVQPAPVDGEDVTQLQEFLIASGFDLGGRLQADGNFGAQTEEAVKAWQKDQGLPQTGRVDSAQLLFSPRPVRIETELRVGAVYEGLEVTPATPAIRITTTERDRNLFEVDQEVAIKTADGSTTLTGTVTKQESVTTETGETSWQTTVTPNDGLPEGASDLEVVVTDVAATDALLVPVSALLALSEGGWAIEVPDGDATKLIGVELIDVLESTAAISGDVKAGDTVLIPQDG